MIQTNIEAIATISLMVIGTMITRFLPFVLFPAGKETPPYILYLGRVLPYSIMGFLVIFCLKSVSLISSPHGLPEAIAILAIVGLHVWKRNVLLSIGGGTLVFMLLVQNVFI